ncbi:MAG: hypothetical protein BM564_13615 [Bacteroidetes bacterium MedPE-SWsnd-G2]|nr:MAG: hypothetical protein BM564_13615 [Bacteroidetes bacterium MedPE-SWsnd-G2]
MNRILKLILLLLIPLFSFGQENDFYDLDNSYHWIFKKMKVKSLKIHTKEYDDTGNLNEEYIELIQNFDKNGDIIWEKEFYDDSTAAWEVNYKYNDNHQTIRTEWTWLDEKDQDLTEYEYNSDNELIKSCDYYKSVNSPIFNLEGCQLYHYKNNRIIKVTDLDDNIESYYRKKGDTILGFSSDKKLKYKYKNGEFVYQKLDSIIFLYERNKINQILKATKTDHHKNIIEISTYEYSNGLLTKVITRNKFGVLRETEEYEYDYNK